MPDEVLTINVHGRQTRWSRACLRLGTWFLGLACRGLQTRVGKGRWEAVGLSVELRDAPAEPD